MNALYLYRKSDWGKELHYSIKSVEMYLKPDRIVVAGDKPDEDVEWIETERKKHQYDDVNNSLFVALDYLDGEDWVLMHDDFFLLEPYKPIIRHHFELFEKIKRTQIQRREIMQKVLDVFPFSMNYSLHYPMPFKLSHMKHLFDVFKMPFSYMNAYGNYDKNFVHCHADDCKFKATTLTKNQLKGLPSFSTYGEDDRFETLLKDLYESND